MNTEYDSEILTDDRESVAGDRYDDLDDYRSLSIAAVVTVVIGLLSIASLMSAVFLVIPAAGIGLGVYAVWTIRRRRDELTGSTAAIAGLVLSAVCFAGIGTMHYVLYRLEEKEGYQRISFSDLQPDKEHPKLPIPPSALELDGKQIIVKGYIYPHRRRKDLQQFILVPDMKACCFGGQPALNDMIEVTLQDPLRINYSYRRLVLYGTLNVHKQLQQRKELMGVYYELDADEVR